MGRGSTIDNNILGQVITKKGRVIIDNFDLRKKDNKNDKQGMMQEVTYMYLSQEVWEEREEKAV